MARSPSIQYYGAIYHIIHEGKGNIFSGDEDKIKLLEIIEGVKANSDFLLLAYSILDNRYDFLVKCHNIPISKSMQRINMAYTKYFNSKYKRKGTPYKDRYKSIVVENENHMLNYIWEIHRIPLVKGLVDNVEEYKWTSDALYKFNVESIVDVGYVLNDLDEDRFKAIKEYTKLMKSDNIYINKDKDNENYNYLDEILRDICKNEMDFFLIKNGSRKAYLRNLKKEYVIRSKKWGYKTCEIGENIGITARAIRKYL